MDVMLLSDGDMNLCELSQSRNQSDNRILGQPEEISCFRYPDRPTFFSKKAKKKTQKKGRGFQMASCSIDKRVNGIGNASRALIATMLALNQRRVTLSRGPRSDFLHNGSFEVHSK